MVSRAACALGIVAGLFLQQLILVCQLGLGTALLTVLAWGSAGVGWLAWRAMIYPYAEIFSLGDGARYSASLEVLASRPVNVEQFVESYDPLKDCYKPIPQLEWLNAAARLELPDLPHWFQKLHAAWHDAALLDWRTRHTAQFRQVVQSRYEESCREHDRAMDAYRAGEAYLKYLQACEKHVEACKEAEAKAERDHPAACEAFRIRKRNRPPRASCPLCRGRGKVTRTLQQVQHVWSPATTSYDTFVAVNPNNPAFQRYITKPRTTRNLECKSRLVDIAEPCPTCSPSYEMEPRQGPVCYPPKPKPPAAPEPPTPAAIEAELAPKFMEQFRREALARIGRC
jgi:hypothetical protein